MRLIIGCGSFLGVESCCIEGSGLGERGVFDGCGCRRGSFLGHTGFSHFPLHLVNIMQDSIPMQGPDAQGRVSFHPHSRILNLEYS